ncbi:putative Ig domain-containing protein [Candidatus Palauibacter sp.]|uniref:putative Ig domain-containing protein n=1 Tax=Candidatus Palauibacter sp. TaxID=3101350 RepID=UPI003B01C6C7
MRVAKAARRVPRAPILVAFALAVLAVLATLAPEQAAAQTVTTFISNTGRITTTATSSDVQATAFRTGTGTYTLSSVALRLHSQTGTPTPAVQIYTHTSIGPGTLVATMTNPATIVGGVVNIFTAPANTTLAANTTYWLVTSNSANPNGRGFRVITTFTGDSDSGTAAGWSIGNANYKTDIRTDGWTTTFFRILFQIRGTDQTNSAPTVANAIPDQSATAGTAFSYVFPDTTFNDTDTGDTLSYAATKADGSTLPTWLAFTAGTRTFAGTPQAADTGTVSVKVTADDGNGGSVSNEFDITVVSDPNAGICARTEAVRDGILAKIVGVTDCANVTDTHLAAMTGALLLNAKSITALAAGDFDGLTALTTLNLNENSLTALPAGVFDELTALTDLHLAENSLTALPARVFDELTALSILDLEDNSLTVLPAGVFDKLTALTYLDLSNNSLTALPAGVFDELTALDQLYLNSNSLIALPAGVFDKLTALTELVLGGNSLTALPDDVFDGLTALTYLSLDVNSLTALPDDVFDQLTALGQLYLNDNSLTALPDDVFEPLTSLSILSLSGNPGAPFSPTAVALPDDGTVPAAGGTVMLDGSGSGGAWGTNVTYAWALTTPTSGVTVTFDSVSIAEPTVTIPQVTAGTDLVFTLTVTGRGGSNGISTATDTAAVTTTTANVAPTVANAIPDQTATAGTAFTYQFPTNTFNDTDTGDTLSYAATKGDDTTLPTWLTFTAGTRTFAGTPTASDVETLAVKVTADDSNGGTVSDDFNIMVAATAPGAPTGLTATASGSTRIDLSWTAPADNGGSAVTGYKIEVSSDSATSWTELVADTAATTYAHTGLAAGTTRHYRVSAINTNGDGPRPLLDRPGRRLVTGYKIEVSSDSATSATTGTTVPGAPASLGHQHQRDGNGQREHPDRPLLDGPGRQRRLRRHRLQDRGLLR